MAIHDSQAASGPARPRGSSLDTCASHGTRKELTRPSESFTCRRPFCAGAVKDDLASLANAGLQMRGAAIAGHGTTSPETESKAPSLALTLMLARA